METSQYIMSMDAGGTMTDTFFVDGTGRFVVGKAQTTPDDEFRGFAKSVEDALRQWDARPSDLFPQIATGIYSGTSMLNRLLERKGRRLGIIVTAGMEDYFQLERGIQTYLGYSYQDRLKVATHRHNAPLVPRDRVLGVRGRIDLFGTEAIPLYEYEVERIVEELLAKDIEGLVVNLLFSYANGAHEQKVKQIAEATMRSRNKTVPIYLSSELYPVMQDFARLNTVTIEAYAAEPSRGQFQKIADRAKDFGGQFELRVMASHGGTISTEAKELARTLISGPIGGMVGSRHLGNNLGLSNVVCTDIGGTSFDLGLITAGEFTTKSQPNMARFVLKLPLIEIDSVGAGTGSYVRLDPISKRIEFGPDSAGSRIRHVLRTGRSGHTDPVGLQHHPRQSQPVQLSRRRSGAQQGPRPGCDQRTDRRSARPRPLRRRRGRAQPVREPSPQRGLRPGVRQGLFARGLHPIFLRRRRPDACRGLHERAEFRRCR